MLSPLHITLGILLGLFLVAGGLVYLRSGLTRYHIPVVVLALFTLTSGALIVAGDQAMRADAEEVHYSVDSQVDGCDTAEADRVSEFDELSPDAQEVFLSTRQSNGRYTTTTNPEEFDISSDNDIENYVVYESDCYALVGYGPGLGTGFARLILLGLGIPFSLGLAVVTVYSYRTDSFRLPAAVVSAVSVGAVIWVAKTAVGAITAGLLVAGLGWVVLGSYDPLKAEDT